MTKRQYHCWRTLRHKKRRGTINDAERIELANLEGKNSEAAIANLTGERCHSALEAIRKGAQA